MPKDVNPGDDCIRAVVDGPLKKTISRIERDVGVDLPTIKVIAAFGSDSEHLFELESQGEVGSVEIRLQFREAYPVGRYLFLAEMQASGYAEDTGFNGFCLRGEIVDKDGEVNVSANSVTMKYSQPDYMGW